jgi:hypothetical protein
MSRRRRRRRRGSDAKTAVRRGVATGSTVTLATLGLSNCTDGGGGAVDPPPPPPLVCADANQGQNLSGVGALQDSTLTVNLFSYPDVLVDTLYVSDVVGATLDSLDASGPIRLEFTVESDTTSQVTFTLAGTFDLDGGPCDFTVTIDNGNVDVAQRRLHLPLGVGRDIRIELVERDGLRIRLKAAGTTNLEAAWRVTAGSFERLEDGDIMWQLPSEPGFYQVELLVDRGERGFGFDALSLEVSSDKSAS